MLQLQMLACCRCRCRRILSFKVLQQLIQRNVIALVIKGVGPLPGYFRLMSSMVFAYKPFLIMKISAFFLSAGGQRPANDFLPWQRWGCVLGLRAVCTGPSGMRRPALCSAAACALKHLKSSNLVRCSSFHAHYNCAAPGGQSFALAALGGTDGVCDGSRWTRGPDATGHPNVIQMTS